MRPLRRLALLLALCAAGCRLVASREVGAVEGPEARDASGADAGGEDPASRGGRETGLGGGAREAGERGMAAEPVAAEGGSHGIGAGAALSGEAEEDGGGHGARVAEEEEEEGGQEASEAGEGGLGVAEAEDEGGHEVGESEEGGHEIAEAGEGGGLKIGEGAEEGGHGTGEAEDEGGVGVHGTDDEGGHEVGEAEEGGHEIAEAGEGGGHEVGEGAEEGGHGTGEAEHEGGHEDEFANMNSVDIAVMVMFFGGAIMGRCGQIILSYPDADVRMSANRMFCVAASIFIAMTIWSLCRSFIKVQVIPSPFPRGLHIEDEGMQQKVLFFIEVCLFAVLWILISLFCHWTGHVELNIWRGAAKTLTPHVCGFAGASVVMNCMELGYAWTGNVIGVAVAAVATCGVLMLCMAASETMRQQRCYTGTLSERERHTCLEAAMEGEDEASAFITSAVLLGIAVVAGHMLDCNVENPVEGHMEHTHCEQAYMRVLMYFLVPLIMLFPCAANSKIFGRWDGQSIFHRSVRNVKIILAMAISRSLLYVTSSAFEGRIEQEAVAQLSTAMLVTVGAIILTIFFDCIADQLEKDQGEEGTPTSVADHSSDSEDPRECAGNTCMPLSGGAHAASPNKLAVEHLVFSTRNFIGVFGLLVGLSWETVFQTGNRTLVTWINDQIHADGLGDHKVVLQTCLTVLVLAVVLPGWAKYIVPRAELTKEFHETNIEHEMTATPEMCGCEILRLLVQRGVCCCCPLLVQRAFCCCCPRSNDNVDESDERETSCETSSLSSDGAEA